MARRPQADNIRTQLARLGDTLFRADRIEIHMDSNWFVPSSLLAEMRREAVERLMADKRIRYQREIVRWKEKQKESAGVTFGTTHLTYLGNVANNKARQFYKEHGIQQVDPAFELAPTLEEPLMFTKHCLRYSMGWCPIHQKGRSPYREPYYLIYKETRLRLQFDCKNCQMLVWAEKKGERS